VKGYQCQIAPAESHEPNRCVLCKDEDGDGLLAVECGGGDCDDNNRDVKPGVIEQCTNELDDNCDGKTDSEDPACTCNTGDTQTCTGAGVCPGSKRTCAAGSFGPCTPPTEICDGMDNDCDSETDEGAGRVCVFGATQDCTTSCSTAGTRTCSNTCTWGPCRGTEVCNGQDDNCDNQTDETFECKSGAIVACTSSCGSTGTAVCDDTTCTRGACEPPDEQCDGVDNDCSNGADDIFTCAKGAPGTASCATTCGTQGVMVCNDTCAAFDRCQAPAEVCNAADDDCVGGPDDGLSSGARRLHSNSVTQPAYAAAAVAGGGDVGYAFAANGDLFVGVAQASALSNPTTAPRTQVTTRSDADAREPDVALGAQTLAVAWREAAIAGAPEIRLALVRRQDSSLAVAEQVIGTARSSTRPRIAWSADGGGRYAISWIDGSDNLTIALYSETGAVIAAARVIVAGVNAAAYAAAIARHPGGGGFSVVAPMTSAQDGSVIPRVRRVSADGQLLSDDVALTSSVSGKLVGSEPVELASAGDRYMAAFLVVETNNTRAVVQASWPASGSPAAAQRVSPVGALVSGYVQLAAQPDGFAVSWTEVSTSPLLKAASSYSGGALRFRRLDEINGTEYVPGNALDAAPAFDGASYWFIWTDNGRVILRRLCP
jgi:hypothetical protein